MTNDEIRMSQPAVSRVAGIGTMVVLPFLLLALVRTSRSAPPVKDFTPPPGLLSGCEPISREFAAAYTAEHWMARYFWVRVIVIEGLRIPASKTLTAHAICAVEWPDRHGRLSLWVYDPYFGAYRVTQPRDGRLSGLKAHPARLVALMYGNAFRKAYYRP
jgi:hypothetical protein